MKRQVRTGCERSAELGQGSSRCIREHLATEGSSRKGAGWVQLLRVCTVILTRNALGQRQWPSGQAARLSQPLGCADLCRNMAVWGEAGAERGGKDRGRGKSKGNEGTGKVSTFDKEGNSAPLQYSCLENPMDGGAWWAAVHGVTGSWAQLSDCIFTFMHWRRKWQPTPVFLPGESQGQRSLVGCHLWGRTESDTTQVT